MRLAWKIVAGAGALAGLAVAAAGIAIATIDPTVFAGPIAQRVKAVTGRDFAAQRIDIKLSLTPRVVLEGVTLGNAPWASAPQMISAKAVELEVALIPLVQRRIEIRRLVLTEPVTSFETDASGRGNWEFGDGAAKSQGVTTPTVTTPPLAALGVSDLVANGGSISYRSGKAGKPTVIAVERLAVAAPDPAAAIAVDFRGAVDAVPIALSGTLPPASSLWARQGALPLKLSGEVAGRKAALAGNVFVDERGYRVEDFDLTYGANRVTGRVALVTAAARPSVSLNLAAATLALSELPAFGAQAPAASKSATPAAAPSYVFGAEPVSFATLHVADVDGGLTVGQLTLADGRRIDRVDARFTLRNGRLDVPQVAAAMYGGAIVAHLKVDAASDRAPAIELRIDAKGLDLPALLAAAGQKRSVRGGKTDIAVDLSMRGVSPRQWASSMSGTVLATIGPATLGNEKTDAPSPLDRLGELVNPFRAIDTTTELTCAVARLPLKDGVAHFDRGVGVETKKVGVLASGTLDFRDETLDVALRPHLRAGVPIEIVRLADLVRLRGSFTAPTVAVDALGSATTIARVGAAVATSGLSIVGESLLKGVTGSGGNECEIARGSGAAVAATPAQAPASSGTPSAATTPSPLKSLERLFRH
jgi:uncharacterized protein involved in outer membrane biogenesis